MKKVKTIPFTCPTFTAVVYIHTEGIKGRIDVSKDGCDYNNLDDDYTTKLITKTKAWKKFQKDLASELSCSVELQMTNEGDDDNYEENQEAIEEAVEAAGLS